MYAGEPPVVRSSLSVVRESLTCGSSTTRWRRERVAGNVKGDSPPSWTYISGGHMRNSVVSFAIAVLLAPAVVVAQDADKKVAGGGELAPGWQMRIDPNASRGAPPKFVAMGPGFHATSGARAIFWRPADVGTGNYKVEGTFTLTKAPARAESYGLVVAGKDLAGPNENYIYFTLGGNGSYLIKH